MCESYPLPTSKVSSVDVSCVCCCSHTFLSICRYPSLGFRVASFVTRLVSFFLPCGYATVPSCTIAAPLIDDRKPIPLLVCPATIPCFGADSIPSASQRKIRKKNGRKQPFVHPDLLARLDGHQRRARDTRHQPSSLRLRGRMCARTQQLHAACHTCHSVCSMPCVALYDTWRRAAVYDSCHVDAMRMPCVVRYAICHNLCCCVVCHISP